LVDFEQQTIASLLFNCGLDAERVRDSQVVTNNLDTALLGEVDPSIPVILVKGILDGDDGVLLDVAQIKISELDTSDPLGGVRVGVLKVQIVLAVLVKLGRGNIESDLNLALVSGLLDSLRQEFQGFISSRDVGGEATFITDVDSLKARQLCGIKLQK